MIRHSNQSLLTSNNDNQPKSQTRPRVSPHIQQSIDVETKVDRSFQPSLQSITEESLSKFDVPQPTKTDLQRDIQVLTLDDNNANTNPVQDEVPF